MRIIDELISKRADAVKNIQALAEQAGGKPMDADLTAKFEAAKADFDNLNEQITTLKQVDMQDIFEPVTKENDAILNYIRTGNPGMLNSVHTSTSSAGYLIDDTMYDRIIQSATSASIMLQIADVIDTKSPYNIPYSGTDVTSYWVAENAAVTESSPTFSRIQLGAHSAAVLVKASRELVEDSAFDIGSYLADRAGASIGYLAEAAFVAGNGTGQPTGVAGAATAYTSSNTASFDYADIVGLFTTIKSAYRKNGSWVCGNGALAKIMQLTDAANHYIFQPSYKEGVPDMLLGRPLYVSDAVAATGTTGNLSVLFGDFNYYKIARRRGVTIQRLLELYAANRQVGFLFDARFDGNLTLSEAVYAMKEK